jgi:hypothetical protein
MSWDLYLVPAEQAGDAGGWLESIANEPGDAAAIADHAGAIRGRRPELESFEPDEGGYLELSAPEDSGLPFQVYLDGRHGAISVAYWDLGERESELAGLVVEVVEALQERTGWILYDPQDDRVVAPEELRASFLGGHEQGVDVVRRIAEEDERPRRGLFGLFRRR